MAIDYSTLTMGEIGQIESLSGQGIAVLENEQAPKGLALAALAFIVKRRENPRFTWNEAQSLTFAEVGDVLGLDTSDDTETETTDADPFELPEASTTSGKRRSKTTD
ncbi:hypothetical protein [Microbacterium sp. A94]|uniref:hypothetical protein n=1 Tax=Microbacterium sp. A94 TaxID=3450717 RepID=UPI003F441565